MGNYFFDQNTFINSVYALDIAIENHFSSYLLNGDLSRVVYSSTDFALRKRSEGDTWKTNLLPFMNYRMEQITEGTDRPLSNSTAKLVGRYIPELKKKIKFIPVTITYDSTIWFQQHLDGLYAMNEVLWDDTSETIVDYSVMVKDDQGVEQELKLFGILGFNYQYGISTSQTDWLESHKIHANTLNFEFQTLMIKEGAEAWLPDSVVFEFAHGKGIDPDSYDTVIDIMHDYTGVR